MSGLPYDWRADVKRESVTVIKTMFEQGRYEVDPQRVADAIIARLLGEGSLPPGLAELQKACSKPLSSSVAPPNVATG